MDTDLSALSVEELLEELLGAMRQYCFCSEGPKHSWHERINRFKSELLRRFKDLENLRRESDKWVFVLKTRDGFEKEIITRKLTSIIRLPKMERVAYTPQTEPGTDFKVEDYTFLQVHVDKERRIAYFEEQ